MPKREFHQPLDRSLFDLSIPYKGNDIHRYLQITTEPSNGEITGKLYTIPIDNAYSHIYEDLNDLFCVGTCSINVNTGDVIYHNSRLNKDFTDGPIVDSIRESYLKQQAEYNFKEYYGYDLNSDYSKQAYQKFYQELNKILKYAGEKSIRINEEFETISYGVMFHHNNGNIRDFTLKTKTNKDILLARIIRKKPYKNFKGSVSIMLPKKPLSYITEAYNENILNFCSSREYDRNPLVIHSDYYHRYFSQIITSSRPETANNNTDKTNSLLNESKLICDDINKSIEKGLINHYMGLFDYLYSLRGSEDINSKLLSSDKSALLYVKLASKCLEDANVITHCMLDNNLVKEFLTEKSPDKIIAKQMLDAHIPAYAVANTIHHYSPWQAVRDDVFADNSNSVNLVKEVLSQSKSVSKSLYKGK